MNAYAIAHSEQDTLTGQSSQSFFLRADQGQRFCIYHVPSTLALAADAAILYVHPFAEEMNRSRRLAALQARHFAAAGIPVLQIDLHGCGDSSDDFADARWHTWKADLALAHRWLSETTGLPVRLWGVRLGAMLALDYAQAPVAAIESFILWQPVLDGRSYLTQFLRLRLANQMLAVGTAASTEDKKDSSTETLRESLRQGHSLEIAGYELAPELAAAIDQGNATDLMPACSKVFWIDVVTDTSRPLATARQRVATHWQQKLHMELQCESVVGPAFWSTQEISDCPALLHTTTSAVSRSA